jgi:hypothetical protein
MMIDRKAFERKEMFFNIQCNLISNSEVYRKGRSTETKLIVVYERTHNCCRPLQFSVSVSTTSSVSFKQDILSEGTSHKPNMRQVWSCNFQFVGSEVLAAVITKRIFFWIVTWCNSESNTSHPTLRSRVSQVRSQHEAVGNQSYAFHINFNFLDNLVSNRQLPRTCFQLPLKSQWP